MIIIIEQYVYILRTIGAPNYSFPLAKRTHRLPASDINLRYGNILRVRVLKLFVRSSLERYMYVHLYIVCMIAVVRRSQIYFLMGPKMEKKKYIYRGHTCLTLLRFLEILIDSNFRKQTLPSRVTRSPIYMYIIFYFFFWVFHVK